MDRAPLVVRELVDADSARWDEFVRRHPDATFFHLSAWRRIVRDVFRHSPHFLYAERAGDIVAVLPLAEVRSRLFGHALTSLPFCVYGGVAGDSDGAVLLERAADTLARRLGVDHLELRNLVPRHADWPRQDLYATFRKAISPADDANLLAIPRKQRAMVRKGMRHGLVATVDAGVDRFFALYADNVRRHGTPALPKAFFGRLLHEFGRDCEVLTVSDDKGRPLSSVLAFYFRNEVLPYYAGDDPAARELAANDFKYWALMQRASARGCRLFDFGRSKIGTGAYAFKKNWGFEPQPLSYEYRLYRRKTVPQNNPMNPKYRMFIALWRRLPLRVATALGPYIVRSLG